MLVIEGWHFCFCYYFPITSLHTLLSVWARKLSVQKRRMRGNDWCERRGYILLCFGESEQGTSTMAPYKFVCGESEFFLLFLSKINSNSSLYLMNKCMC